MKSKRFVSILVLLSILVTLVGILPAAAATVVTVSLDPATIPAAGGTFTVNARVNATVPIRGIQFDLDYDPAVMTLNSVSINPNLWRNQGSPAVMTCTGGTPTAEFNNPGAINNTTGYLDALGTSPLGVPAGNGCTGSGVVATLTFTAVANGQSVNSFAQVTIPGANNISLPPASTTVDGYEAIGSSVRVGPGPNVGVASLAATRVDDTHFTVTFTPQNTGLGASDPTAYTVTASNTVEASSSGTVPAIPAGGTGAAIGPISFTLNAGMTQSTVTVSIPEFGAVRTTLFVSGVTEAGDVPVDATFLAFLDLSLPTLLDFGYLEIGANTVDGSLNVRCNASYAVDVTSARNFHLTEWNQTTYGAASLFSAMQVVSSQSIVTNPPLANGSRLVTGAVAGQVQDLGQNWPFYLSQVLTYQDPLLPTGSTYHDVLTFNAYVTF